MNRRQFLKLSSFLPSIAILPVNIEEGLFWDDVNKRIAEFTIQYWGEELSHHPALWKGSKFRYNSKLLHIQVAQEWGCTPSELSAMSYKDRVDIYAWYVVKKQMEKIVHYEQSRKQKRK